MTFLSITMITSVLFFFSKHPMTQMILIITQALTTTLIVYKYMNNAWFPIILFLIFLGGVMILFIYITSLASNEMFYFNPNWKFNMSVIMSLSILTIIYMSPSTNKNFLEINTMKMYSMSSFSISTLIMIYLLLTLLIVVFLLKNKEGPLRTILK